MTATVYLIRHGETESNIQGYHMGWSNEELNATGFAQAESVASRLAKVPFSTIYSSSSRRAMSTAEIIGRYHDIKPIPMPELREINYGEWEGQKRNEMRDKYPEIHRKLRTDPIDIVIPGGESFKQVSERALHAFNTIVAAGEDRCVALISHSVPLKILIANALGVPYKMWDRFGMGNTSISIIQVTNGVPRLVTLNDRAHLEGKERS